MRIYLLIFALLVLPVDALALVSGGGFVDCQGPDCSACNLVSMANRVIDWLVGVLIVLFAVMIVIRGFGLVTSRGNPGALSEAKETLINAIIGLLIILAAWIIVDTLMRGLNVQGMSGGPLPWSRVQCQVQITPDVNRSESPASANVLPQYANPTANPASAAQAQQTLATAGVAVQPGVALAGVSQDRLNEITRMAEECAAAMGRSCGIQVSSGMRYPGNPAGVGAHGNGQALDLSSRNSPVFNEWMQTRQTTYPRVQSFSGYSGYQISPGTVCTWEGPDADSSRAHWHCAPPTR
jgi:hypothetical protein